MTLTDEDYAAAARAAGGTGAAFAPPVPSPILAFNIQEDALAKQPAFVQGYLGGPPAPPPMTSAADQAALAAANAAPGRPAVPMAPSPIDVGRDIRTLGRPGEPVFREQQATRPDAMSHLPVSQQRRPQVIEGDIPEEGPATTADLGAAGAAQRGAGGPVIFSRGGIVPAGFDERNIPIRKETRQAQMAALQRSGAADVGVAEAQRASALERADYLGGVAEAAETRMADRQRRYADRQQEIDAQGKKLNAAVEDAKNAAVTQDGFLERHPGSILMAIGATLGGILSARTGQPNSAMAALDNAIDRDIALQKDAAARKQQNVGNQQSLVGMMRTRFDDEQQRDMAMELAHRQVVDTQLQRLGAKAQNPEQAAAIEKLKAYNEGKQVDLKAAWDQAAHHRAYALPGTGASSADANKTDRGLMVTLEDGRTIVAPTQDEATKARESQVGVRNLESMSRRINQLREMPEAYAPLTEQNAELQELGPSFVDAVRLQGKSGSLDQGFVNQSIARFGDPTNPLSRFGQRTEAFTKRARQAYGDTVRSFAGERVQRGYEVDTRGNITPAKRYVGEQVNPRAQQTTKREGVK